MRYPRRFTRFVLCLFLAAAATLAHAQVPVVMLSDVHFDPFHDPAKLPQLRAEPVDRWPAILSAPATPTQAADLDALQTACNARALDTAWPLFQTTLRAAHDAERRPTFVTLSGDLLTHEFACRFQHLAPDASAQDLAAFAAKTVTFVMAQLRGAFPRTPVYGALGNNDSGCADYRESAGDAFLQTAAPTLATVATTPEGDYSVLLPAPLQRTRLIVLQDIFESRQFTTCGDSADRSPEKSQIDWLRTQLADARAHGEHVWVMSHVPPGVDVYTSFRRYLLQPAEMCNAKPTPFLADTTLADALLDYADTVRLALFGHTHMDEIRLLHRDADGTPTATVPAKLVPSVTPFFSNHPAFLVATVDPQTAVLKDWRTIVSPGAEGSTPPWAEGYRFTIAYHLPDFSAASALKLADTFTADKLGQSPQSTTFRQHFYAGDVGLYALGLAQIWPAYACSIRNHRPSAVHSCICAALPAPKNVDTQP